MKRLLSFVLSLALVFSLIPFAFAASSEATEAAQSLYELGLFNGTGTDANGNPIFDLDRTPTRHEAVTMLVRLLGKSEEAENGTWNTPFTDVADWAKPYVGYAYTNSLTAGTSATTYGGDSSVAVAQYLTFVLRALGYSSGTDFQWDRAWELSDSLGITNGQYNANTTAFTRGDVAIISYNALDAQLNGTSKTLRDTLGIPADTAPTPDRQPKQPKEQITWYEESEYRVGSDIPAGKYYAEQTSNYPGYYCVYADTRKDDIIQNENFNNYTFFTVSDGQLLSLSRCKITSESNVASSIAKQEDGEYVEGCYRVGIDIPAGEYKLTQNGENPGYYCIYSDVSKEDIVDNDIFRGSAYCTVREGEYLKVNRATFVCVEATSNDDTTNADSEGNPSGSITYSEVQTIKSYLDNAYSFMSSASDYSKYPVYNSLTMQYISSARKSLDSVKTIINKYGTLTISGNSSYSTLNDWFDDVYITVSTLENQDLDADGYSKYDFQVDVSNATFAVANLRAGIAAILYNASK